MVADFERDGYRFHAGQPIGCGAFGEVIRVDKLGFRGLPPSPAAAKILTADRDHHYQLAVAEVKLMQDLANTPNVLGYLNVIELGPEAGPWQGRIALIMELANGDLRKWRRGRQRPHSQDIERILLGVARGLKAIHDANLAHGDLHAGNVFNTRTGWKVGDLSASERVDPRTGRAAHRSAGSPQAFSPERRSDGLASKQDDMWALGILLLYAVTGRYPFSDPSDGPSSAADVQRALTDLSGPIASIATKLLAWQPSHRPTARDLVREMEMSGLGATPPNAYTDDGGDTTPLAWPAAVAQHRPGHLEIFQVEAGLLRFRWSIDTGVSWSRWHDMDMGAELLVDVCASSLGIGHQDVFVTTGSGQIRHRWLSTNPPGSDHHSGWSELSGMDQPEDMRAKCIAAASIDDGHMEVYAVDDMGRLWSRWYWLNREPKGWSRWMLWQETPPDLVDIQACSVRQPGIPASALIVAQDAHGDRWSRLWLRKDRAWSTWQSVHRNTIPTVAGPALLSPGNPSQMIWEDNSPSAEPVLWVDDMPRVQLMLPGAYVGTTADWHLVCLPKNEDQPAVTDFRNELAHGLQTAGHLERAISMYHLNLRERMRMFGTENRDTLAARDNLACAYQAGIQLAIDLFGRNLQERIRIQGRDNPETLATRNSLAFTHQQAGNMQQAVALFQENLAELIRVLGPNHPDTVVARERLAHATGLMHG